MSDDTQILAGILFLSLVTVETGGLLLVRLWTDPGSRTPFQIGFARAGHAHAGVLLVLGLLCQLYVDGAGPDGATASIARLGVPVAALLMPGGFFAASAGAGRTTPNRYLWMVFAGAAAMAVGLATLGVALIVNGV